MQGRISEFLFIDERRVSSYYEQTRKGSLLKVEKSSSWTVSATLTSPGVKGQESTAFREATILEKLEAVETHIRESIQLSSEENSDRMDVRKYFDVPIFGEATYSATRALLIPSDRLKEIGFNYLAIWVPDYEEVQVSGTGLYLIEVSPEGEKEYVDVCSGYSALEFLLEQVDRHVTDILESEKSAVALEGLQRWRQLGEGHFHKDPIWHLKRLDATIFSPRRIRCVYRRRLAFEDASLWKHYNRSRPEVDFRRPLGVIGYPLYIAEA